MARLAALMLVGAIWSVLAVSAAGAARLEVGYDDPTGDAPNPQLDLKHVEAVYDTDTGLLGGAVVLAATPTYQVIDDVDFHFGRFAVKKGALCDTTFDATVTIPDPTDMENGFPWPFVDLYQGDSADPIGPLPSNGENNPITFSSVESPEVVRTALKGKRFNCVWMESAAAGTYKSIDDVPDLALIAGPTPACKLRAKSVRAGRAIVIRCTKLRGKVTARLYRSRPMKLSTKKVRVKHGTVRLRTTRSMRGKGRHGLYRVTLWRGDTVIARFDDFRVR